MNQIIAFEGTMPANAAASWHTPVLRGEDGIYNPVTGRRITQQHLDDLAASGHVTLLKAPITLHRYNQGNRPIVYVAAKSHEFSLQFRVPTNKFGPFVQSAHSHTHYIWAFEKASFFESFRVDQQESILRKILTDLSDNPQSACTLARLGLSLGRSHPGLNAAWVHFSPEDRRELTHKLASIAVPVEALRDKFTTYLRALSADHTYELKYEDGIAEGGGLDVDDASNTLNNILAMHPALASEVARQHRFLAANQVPQMHLQELKAASASLNFAVRTKGSLRDQVSRYLELTLLEECVAGRVPESLQDDSEFMDALERLLCPSEATSIQHKPLNSTVSVPIARMTVTHEFASVVRTDKIRVLCFLCGIYQNSERAEVMLASPARRRSGRISFSLIDRGDKTPPDGLDMFDQGNSFLYRPLVLSLHREILDNGSERYRLQDAVNLTTQRDVVFTALPSAVVPGAFIVGREYRAKLLPSDRLVTDFWEYPVPSPSRKVPKISMKAFMDAVSAEELKRADDPLVCWRRPARTPLPSEGDRCVVALNHAQGRGSLRDVLDIIHDSYDTVVTASNTLKALRAVQHLIRVDGEGADSTLEMTQAGRAYAKVYLNAGGDMGSLRKED